MALLVLVFMLKIQPILASIVCLVEQGEASRRMLLLLHVQVALIISVSASLLIMGFRSA